MLWLFVGWAVFLLITRVFVSVLHMDAPPMLHLVVRFLARFTQRPLLCFWTNACLLAAWCLGSAVCKQWDGA